MTEAETCGESRDGRGSGDHDVPFEFGCEPRSAFTEREWVRVLLMRGLIQDMSHAPMSIRNEMRYGGDDDHVRQLDSGVYVPADYEPTDDAGGV